MALSYRLKLRTPGENLSAHLVSFLSEPGVVFALHTFFELDCDERLPARL